MIDPIPNQHNAEITPEIENSVGISLKTLTDLYVLQSVKRFGPQKFLQLKQNSFEPHEILQDPKKAPFTGKEGAGLISRLTKLDQDQFSKSEKHARRQLIQAHENSCNILTPWNPLYPDTLIQSRYPAPILYVKGDPKLLNSDKSVACVGSRKIREPYAGLGKNFGTFASDKGFTVVSGFATGSDRIGHESAYESGGKTILVMAGGLDRPFPPENRGLWNQLNEYPYAVAVTEAPFATGASSLLLRRRNKLIVALSNAVMIFQSTSKGGAMNAFRFALEQKKSVATFDHDSTEDTGGNKEISDTEKVYSVSFSSLKSDEEAWFTWLSKRYSLI